MTTSEWLRTSLRFSANERISVLLVARHARADDPAAAREVAERLVESIEDLAPSRWALRVTDIEHSDTDPSRDTAEIFAEAFAIPARVGDVALSRKLFRPYPPAQVDNQAVVAGDPVETSWKRIDNRLFRGAVDSATPRRPSAGDRLAASPTTVSKALSH